MDTNKILLFLLSTLAILTFSYCECEPDEFGEMVTIQIPIDIGEDRNTFLIGDTLWVQADFPKDVRVLGHQNRMELIDFKFFSLLGISEISQPEFRPYIPDNILLEEGDVNTGQLGINYSFAESSTGYSIKFGVPLQIPGKFFASSSTDVFEQEGYVHPAFFTCDDNVRTNFFIDRVNRFSTQDNFEDLVDWNQVVTDGFTQTFEGYQRSAGFAFEVVE